MINFKKIILTLLLIFTSAIIVFAASPQKLAKPSEYNLGISYNEELKSNKPALLLFYTDWCTYCRKFMPIYKQLGADYSDKFNLVMLNAESNRSLAKKFRIEGYPSLFIFDPKYNTVIEFNPYILGNIELLHEKIDSYLVKRAK